ncbi:MAG: hypothetical protein WCF18_23940 [Chthoniobacteraceae bacterium]
MKTITEYRPLIFSRILDATRAVEPTRQSMGWNVGVVVFYCAAGLWLFVDTGFAPWNWQFWTAFGPLFIAGELAVNEILVLTDPRRGLDGL